MILSSFKNRKSLDRIDRVPKNRRNSLTNVHLSMNNAGGRSMMTQIWPDRVANLRHFTTAITQFVILTTLDTLAVENLDIVELALITAVVQATTI